MFVDIVFVYVCNSQGLVVVVLVVSIDFFCLVFVGDWLVVIVRVKQQGKLIGVYDIEIVN